MGLKKEEMPIEETKEETAIEKIINFYLEVERSPTEFELHENVRHFGLSPLERDELYAHYNVEKPRKKHNAIHRAMKAKKAPEIAQERVSEAFQYLTTLYAGNDMDAFFFVFVKHREEPYQASYRLSEISEDFVKRLLSFENVFVSVNTYYKRKRTAEGLQRFSSVFLDFDKVKDPKGFLDDLEASGRLQGIPPSMAVSSGNGLHLYWLLDDCYANRKMAKFVDRVQSEMLKRFPEADKQVKDGPRVLRLPGSLNMKNYETPKDVRLLSLENQPHYTIDQLGREILPLTTEKVAELKKPKEKKKLKASASNLIPFQKNIQSLLHDRMGDMEIYLRHDAPNTRRRVALFLYRHFSYLKSGNKQKALHETLAMNARLPNPVDEIDIKNHTGSAVKDRLLDKRGNPWRGYLYKNETIIEMLEISPELQKKMSTIISEDEKNARRRKRVNEQYAPIKKETARRKESLVERAKALKSSGRTIKQIASEIDVSERTVQRYLKQNLK